MKHSEILKLIDFNKPFEEQFELLKTIFNQVGAYIYINDMETVTCVWLNKYGTDWSGYTVEEMRSLGKDFFMRLMHPDDIPMIEHSIKLLYEQPHKAHAFRYRCINKKNEVLHFYGKAMVLTFTETGLPKWILNINLDITELVEQNVELTNQLNKSNAVTEMHKRVLTLSKRELLILKQIGMGKTSKQIAGIFYVSKYTVDTHRKNIMRKLRVNTTKDLIIVCKECELLDEKSAFVFL